MGWDFSLESSNSRGAGPVGSLQPGSSRPSRDDPHPPFAQCLTHPWIPCFEKPPQDKPAASASSLGRELFMNWVSDVECGTGPGAMAHLPLGHCCPNRD